MNAPEKIYLNPDIVPHNQSGKFLFIHNSDIDESKCTIEYARTDAFIEKACEWLKSHADDYGYTWYNEMEGESGITDNCIDDFRNYMKGKVRYDR